MLNQGRVEEGLEIAQRAYDLSTDIGNAWGQVNSMYHLAFGKLEQGAYMEARVLAERCVALTEEFKLHVLQVNSYNLLGIVQRFLRQLDEACATHQMAVKLGQHISSSALTAVAASELCADYALLERWDDAEALALQVANGKSDLFVMVFGLSRWYVTEALARTNHLELATEDLACCKARIEESPRPGTS